MGQRFRDVDATLLYDGRRRRAAVWMRYWLCPASNLAPAPGFAAEVSRRAWLRRGPIIIGGLPSDHGRRLYNASGIPSKQNSAGAAASPFWDGSQPGARSEASHGLPRSQGQQ